MDDRIHVPSEDDWRSEAWSLDTEWAYRKFRGKTMEEAVRLFEDDAMACQEDLMSMPGRVLPYYLRSCMTYLMSEAAKGDSNDASRFISLIDFKVEHQRDDIVPLWPEIEPVLRRLAEQQDDSDANEWLIHGSFRAQIHQIVQRGLTASFDTAIPEVVPQSVTLWDMAYGVPRALPLPVAVQVLRNSGIDQIDSASRKPDILRIFGTPDEAGGGDHPTYGHIPDWIRYKRGGCAIRFELDGDCISNVMFLSAQSDSPGLSAGGEDTEPLAPSNSPGLSAGGEDTEPLAAQARAIAAWEALFEPPPPDQGSNEHGM